MIRNITVAFSMVLLAACGHADKISSTPKADIDLPSHMPTLPDDIMASCQGLPLIADTSVDALKAADRASSRLYSICKKRHSAVVEAYLKAQKALDEYIQNKAKK